MKAKRILLFAVIALILLVVFYVIGTGFTKNTGVVLIDHALSEDGSQMTLTVGIPTSIGYVRGFRDNGGGLKPHYLDFYNTFGGINSPLGAKSQFVLELSDDDTEIWFNRPGGGYALVLEKNADGQWIRSAQ